MEVQSTLMVATHFGSCATPRSRFCRSLLAFSRSLRLFRSSRLFESNGPLRALRLGRQRETLRERSEVRLSPSRVAERLDEFRRLQHAPERRSDHSLCPFDEVR